MQRLLILAVPAVVTATKCAPGHTHKDNLVNAFCSTSATDAASCDSGCCKNDMDTCGGVVANGQAAGTFSGCPFGTYMAMDNDWKIKKTTAGTLFLAGKTAEATKTVVKDCCQPVVTCDNTLYSCPAGYKKSANHKTKCPAGPKSCGTVGGACCEADVATCGGFMQGANKANAKCDATTTGVVATPAVVAADFITVPSDDSWKSIKAPAAGFGTNAAAPFTWSKTCCEPKPTCASLTCPAGYKKVTANKDKFIDGATVQVSNAGTSNEDELKKGTATKIAKANACCEKEALTATDKTTCGTITVSCPGGEYFPAKAYSHILANAGNMASKCCAPVATCAAAVCPAGYKMKAKVDTHACHGDHTTCKSVCCEVDKTTCGGLATSITCAYGTYDESATWVLSGDAKTSQATMDAWNSRPATAATKNTACCTPAAACKLEPLGTTTPAAAVTTTPAVPV